MARRRSACGGCWISFGPSLGAFLDEFETTGKERGDLHETGEIKRVIATLLLQRDDLSFLLLANRAKEEVARHFGTGLCVGTMEYNPC